MRVYELLGNSKIIKHAMEFVKSIWEIKTMNEENKEGEWIREKRPL